MQVEGLVLGLGRLADEGVDVDAVARPRPWGVQEERLLEHSAAAGRALQHVSRRLFVHLVYN